MGHVANDPELRQTKNGKMVTSFALATDRDWIDSSGEKRKVADFHKIVVWQKLAEICTKYLAKGAAIMVDGRLSNRQYELASSEKRSVTEVIADTVNIISFKKAKSGDEKVLLHDVDAVAA